MSRAEQAQYANEVTELSQRQLRSVFDVVVPPICLLGGWAVHFHVNEAFEDAIGRPYIGSRDIDLGVYVDPTWDQNDLESSMVAESYERIRDELEYEPSRFGFIQHFHRESGEQLEENEVQEYAQHEVFPVYVDLLASTPKLDAFQETFGFRPPDEPLLQKVFDEGASEPLSNHMAGGPPDVKIASAPVLAAMKVRALPERDKSHKRLKDVADLHALLWYADDYQSMVGATCAYLNGADVASFRERVSDSIYQRASRLISEDEDTLVQSINQFIAQI
jgi:hypothetical protein